MLIESSQNSNFKLWKSLRRKKYRKENNLFIVEGKKLFREATFSDILINSVILKEDFNPDFVEEVFKGKIYILKEQLFNELSEMEHAEGILCICEKKTFSISTGSKVIILDGIKDPGNAGTIIRSAEAFGFKDCIFMNDCVDPYNSKVIRGSMGSIFRINIIEEEIIGKLKKEGYSFLILDMRGKAVSEFKGLKKTAVIIGSEAHGVSADMRNIADGVISIPMEGKVESLNAGIAASITMYELNK